MAPPGADWQLDKAGGAATCRLTLRGGQHAAFVLWLNGEGAGYVTNPAQALEQTVAYWQTWAEQCAYEGPYHTATKWSAAPWPSSS